MDQVSAHRKEKQNEGRESARQTDQNFPRNAFEAGARGMQPPLDSLEFPPRSIISDLPWPVSRAEKEKAGRGGQQAGAKHRSEQDLRQAEERG